MEAGTRRGVNHVQGSALTRSAKSARFQDYRTMEGLIGSNLLLGHGTSRLLFAGIRPARCGFCKSRILRSGSARF